MLTMTSEILMQDHTKEKLTSLPEDSHASPLVLPGSDKARQMTVTSGLQCIASLEKLNHDGSFVKTFTALLIGTGDWYSTRCNLTWKLKGTKLRRMYCQLQVSMHRIKDTGCGLSASILNMPPKGNRKLIPTPTAFDGNAPGFSAKLRKDETADSATKLTAYVLYNWTKLLPTPMASDCNYKQKTANWRGDDLGSKIQVIVGRTGLLNPRFVGEMMGFPPDWTILPFQNGAPNP